MELTKDADALICLIYKQYCLEKKSGLSKFEAKMLGSSKDIHETVAPKWSLDDVDETCKELSRAGLLGSTYADNVVHLAWLSDEGIIYMEHRFRDGLKSVLSYLEKIRNILPL